MGKASILIHSTSINTTVSSETIHITSVNMTSKKKKSSCWSQICGGGKNKPVTSDSEYEYVKVKKGTIPKASTSTTKKSTSTTPVSTSTTPVSTSTTPVSTSTTP